MLFKLSLKNMKKSIKDFAIYFLTLVLGVAIFYMFNSIDSQQAMLEVSKSQRETIKLMIQILNFISVFVAIILGLLIIYANHFLINRRKKEFGIYMTLGMSKKQISKIILLETVFVGIISLIVGIIVGIFVSQFMSILVAKMFEANMSKFEFVFSKAACIKTCICFAIMYLFVLSFNTGTISKYKLIDLLNASKKNEKVKMKNPIICVITFIISCGILGYAYWKVTKDFSSISSPEKILIPIIMGIVGTILAFWSFSGFILQMVQINKKTYLKGTNMFVLRQINNKINTTVASMSIICIMLFMTITILSTGFSLRNAIEKDIKDVTSADLNITKTAYLPENIKYTKEKIEDSKIPITETLKTNDFDMNQLKDIVEIPIYETKELIWKNTLGTYQEKVSKKFSMLNFDEPESIIKITDYNKIAKLYGKEQYTLKDNEYMIICDFTNMTEIRNEAIKAGNNTITLKGKQYNIKYNECKDGYIYISTNHMNAGIILVPDSCNLTEKDQEQFFLAANYNAKTEEEKNEIEKNITDSNSKLVKNLTNKGIILQETTKISILESSIGIATIVTFIAIYLGIIFLIASSAILALKQLTESTDNKQRYTILRKIGCDEKMINQSLFRQIGIFFAMPLVLAIIHSIFGIQFGLTIISAIASKKELLPSIIMTVAVIGVIYGTYFTATYLESKNIIKEEE